MKKYANVKLPKIIFQKSELIEVTDPVEFADLERRVKAAKKAMAAGEAAPRKRPARKAK